MHKAVNTAVSLVTLFVLYKVFQMMQHTSKGIGETLGGAVAKVSMFLNGSHSIEATHAGIALTTYGLEKHGEVKYFLSKGKREVWAAMHPDNAEIVQAVFDVNGYVKPRFLSYIDNVPVYLDDVRG